MPRSPSPDRRSERSYHSSSRHTSRRDDRDRDRDERRRSRSPRRRETDEAGRREREDRRERGKERERSRSRSRSRDRHRRSRRGEEDRSRSRSRSRDRRWRHDERSSRRRSRTRSRSYSSGSESDDSRDRRHRRKRHGSRDRDDKDEPRRRREEKKARRAKREEKKRTKAGLATVEWGKHGILTEADIYTKSDEFHAWLIGEKMLNPETLSKAKEKEIFKQFMEDYNTGTLPNEKYYDIKQYEQRMTAVRMGETVEKSDSYDFMKDLEAAKSSQRRSAAASSEQLMDRSRLEELRKLQTDRVQKEKMQRLGMDVSENLGVRLEDKLR
ncbi:hypothetical protein OF846_000395 [Rhodotorula toruloides]|nr:hypothetical protein OF846_000395 [Rhodotorula toruloides]